MIERVIENWLTNTNEIGYQVPFCQYLISEGYTVLHLSSHGQMEQGKDIISVDSTGRPCAFQLKGGNIDLPDWRKIKGEVDELVEHPINYPGVPKDIGHRAVLVTNGEITDPVRRSIDDLNAAYERRGFSRLELITKMNLLERFLRVHDVFLPKEPSDFKLFLELLLSDGRELVNKELTSKFIESILFLGKETKPELKRKIASGLLLNKYLARKFESEENHISILESWVLFGSYILALVEKYSLEPEYWKQSFDLVLYLIKNESDSLSAEFFSKDVYIEDSWDGGFIYKSRLTMVLGWLSATELFKQNIDNTYVLDRRLLEKMKACYKEGTWYWGESATPYFIAMSQFAYQIGDLWYSSFILVDLIAKITVYNTAKDGDGFPNPYYSGEQVLNQLYRFPERELSSDCFLGSSYHLSTIVDMLVRRKKRISLNELWKSVPKLLLCQFKPFPIWRVLTWHCEEGEQVELFYDQPQSWGKLQQQAQDYSTEGLPQVPKVLLENPFSYFFLLCFPHRLTRQSIKLTDKV